MVPLALAISAGVGFIALSGVATVVIGGIVSSTFLALLLLPALYSLFHGRRSRPEQEDLV